MASQGKLGGVPAAVTASFVCQSWGSVVELDPSRQNVAAFLPSLPLEERQNSSGGEEYGACIEMN